MTPSFKSEAQFDHELYHQAAFQVMPVNGHDIAARPLNPLLTTGLDSDWDYVPPITAKPTLANNINLSLPTSQARPVYVGTQTL